MMWYRQVLHVAAKDLRQAKWALAAYAALTGLSITWATAWPAHSSSMDFVASLLSLVATFVACLLVQADSPVRADAFWATRPLSSTAVVAAKVVAVSLGILLPGVLGELIVYRWYAVPAGDIPMMLTVALAVYGAILLIAMAIAALTPNVTSFFITLLLFVIVDLAISSLQGTHEPTIFLPGPSLDLSNDVPLVLWALALAYLYRTRNARRGRQIGAVAMAATMILPTTTFTAPPSSAPAVESSLAHVTSAAITRLNLAPYVECRLRVTGAPGDLIILAGARGYLERADGRREWVPTDSGPDVTLNAPRLNLEGGVRWVRDQAPARDSGSVNLMLTEEQGEALRRGDAHLRIVGEITVERARLALVLPLHVGAVGNGTGRRFQLDSIAQLGRLWLTIRAATVEGSASPLGSWGPDQVAFVLSNAARGEAIRLRATDGADRRYVALPLPGGATLSSLTLEEQMAHSVGFTAPVIDQEWMRGAQLDILEWRPVQTRPINLVVDPKLIARR